MASIIHNDDGSATVENETGTYIVPGPPNLKQQVVAGHLAANDPNGPYMLAWNYGGVEGLCAYDRDYAVSIGYQCP